MKAGYNPKTNKSYIVIDGKEKELPIGFKPWSATAEGLINPKEKIIADLTKKLSDAGFDVTMCYLDNNEITLEIRPPKLTDYSILELLKAVRDKIDG